MVFRNMRKCIVGIVLLLGGCFGGDEEAIVLFEAPETAVSYTVELNGLPDEAMVGTAEEALAVYRQQENGAQSLAFLKRRAKGDSDLLQRILRSGGYYNGTVDIAVTEVEAPEQEDSDQETSESPGDQEAEELELALVKIDVEPGPAFTLKSHTFRMETEGARAPEAAALGSPVGQAAAAAPIVDAETAAVEQLKRAGYPYAKSLKRRAVADLEAATLEVETPISSGPSAAFGEVTYEGLEDVRSRYLQTYLPWEPGDVLDIAKLRAFQRELLGTDLFDTVSVRIPEEPPESESEPVLLPVTVVANERPFRTASAGARYSTDDGPSVSGGLAHRNLFGENETVTLQLDTGIEQQRIGIGYKEPQYLRPGQDFVAGLVVKREEDDAFDDLTATGTVGLRRRLSKYWVVGAGLLGEASLITDKGEDTTAYLGGIPVYGEYDDTDDLLNPTSGTRFRGQVTPFGGVFEEEPTYFLNLDTSASGYIDLLGDEKYILAGRGRAATIFAEDVDRVPQTRRLYSGGGGSVRGYAQRFVGELDSDNDPVGGLSALELSGEVRAKVYGDLGGVLFVDAGSVSAETYPDFENGIQVAAGFGFRYYSPAGPIRLDFAIPVNGRDADDAFQFYFSIGQAF